MGEYAIRRADRRRVKIGTLDRLTGLRLDQRDQVRPEPGSVDVSGPAAVGRLFRFPWPDEDNVRPGAFSYDGGMPIPGATAPGSLRHLPVRFEALGYVVALPCPESLPGLRLWDGGPQVHTRVVGCAVILSAQALLSDGRAVPVCTCRPCGAWWALQTPREVDELVRLLTEKAEGHRAQPRGLVAALYAEEVARRVIAGAVREARPDYTDMGRCRRCEGYGDEPGAPLDLVHGQPLCARCGGTGADPRPHEPDDPEELADAAGG